MANQQFDFIVKNGLVVQNGKSVSSVNTSTGALLVSGGIGVTGNINASGNFVTLGNFTATGNVSLGSLITSLVPQTTGNYDLGSSSKVWNNAYSKSLKLTGGVDSVSSSTGDLIISGGAAIQGNLVHDGIIFTNVIKGSPLHPDKLIDRILGLNNTNGDLVVKGYDSTAPGGTGGNVYITAGIADTGTNVNTPLSGQVVIQGAYPNRWGNTELAGIHIKGSGSPVNDPGSNGDSSLGRYVLIEAGNKNHTYVYGGNVWETANNPANSAGMKGGNLILGPGYNPLAQTDVNGNSTVGGIYIGSDWANENRRPKIINIGNYESTTTVYGPRSFSTLTGALVVQGGIGAANAYVGELTVTNKLSILTSFSVGSNLSVGGNLNVTGRVDAGEIYDNGSRVLTAGSLAAAGVVRLTAGTGTAISTSTGDITVWNTSTLQIVTSLGSSTNQAISITNSTAATNNTTGALKVTGGVGVSGSLYAAAVYDNNIRVVSAATAGTDTSISISSGNISIWNTSTLQTITNRGATTNQAISITNTTSATNTSSGALKVAGGVGIGGNLYAAALYAPTVFDNGNRVVTAGTAGTDTSVVIDNGNISIWNDSTLQSVSSRGSITDQAITITNTTEANDTATGALIITGGVGVGGKLYASELYDNGYRVLNSGNAVAALFAGTDTAVSGSSGEVTVWNNSTLQSVTSRGASTDQAITLTNDTTSTGITSGALKVAGGIGAYNAYLSNLKVVGNTPAASTLSGALVVTGGVGVGGSLYAGSIYSDGNPVLTQGNIASIAVATLTAGTDTEVSSQTGDITIWNKSTLQSVTSRSSSTDQAITISNTTSATSVTTGALKVAGGVGVSGRLYAGALYSNNSPVITQATLGAGTAVTSLTAGTDTAITTSSGNVTIWNTSTLQTITDRGAATSNAISITNTSPAFNTASGALIVSGGLAVGKSLHASTVYGGTVYSEGSLVLTQASLNNYGVASLTAGTGTAVSTSSGVITVWNTSTLQSITSYASTTTNPINIINNTAAQNTTSGALIVSGGIGAGNAYLGLLTVSGNSTFSSPVSITDTTAATTNTGALKILSGGITANTAYFNSVNAGKNGTSSTFYGPVTFGDIVTFNGAATYVLSTNTVYTDNIIELHTPPGGVNDKWTMNDAKDVGLRFHYFNGTDTNAALVMNSSNRYLEWYGAGSELNGSNFATGEPGVFKTGALILTSSTVATNTMSGALIVEGGVGVGGSLYAAELYDNGNRVVNETSIGQFGVKSITAGTDTVVSTSTGAVVIWNPSTLQSVVSRGTSTNVNILINGVTFGSGQNGQNTNIGIGNGALNGNLSGSENIALGSSALFNNYDGIKNIAIGPDALRNNSGGVRNIAIGDQSLNLNQIGTENIAVGYLALSSNQAGDTNIAIGSNALMDLASGNNNISIGNNAGKTISGASGNVVIGGFTGNSGGLDVRTSNNNIVLSDGAGNVRLYIDGQGDVGIGTTDTTNKLNVVGKASVSSAIMVGTGATARTSGAPSRMVYSSGNFSTAGDAQSTVFLLRGTTYSTYQTVYLTSDGDTPSSGNQIVLPLNSSVTYKILLTGKGVTDAVYASYELTGLAIVGENSATAENIMTNVNRIYSNFDPTYSTEPAVGVGITGQGQLVVSVMMYQSFANGVNWLARVDTVELIITP